MKYNFDKVIDRRNTNSIKWDFPDKIFGQSDIIPMWVADMDFSAPQEVIEAIKERADHGAFGYTVRPNSYYQSIMNWQKRRHNYDIEKEWICFSPGVVVAINAAVRTFTEKGDKILIQSPVYTPFFSAIKNNGREIVNNKLILKNNRYEIDFADLEEKFKKGVKMMIFCSPHNPIGRVWTGEELEKIGELCLRYGVKLVSDEIHGDIVFKGHKHIPIASLSKELADITITCISPSKTFNLPGLQSSSIIISNKEMRYKFIAFMENFHIDLTNVFGITATEAAYNHGEEWLEDLLVYIEGNLNYMQRTFEEYLPNMQIVKPEGTYLVWIDFSHLGMEYESLNEFMIKKARIGLNKGNEFGPGGEMFQRVNIACPRVTLEEGIRRIQVATNSLKV